MLVKISFLKWFVIFGFLCSTIACRTVHSTHTGSHTNVAERKMVIYQVFTRLFGNTNTTNKPWGTIEENGVGKFADFTGTALDSIKALGATHIWYTGVPHHAVIRDYTVYGIHNDDPDVVKGRAGSPYAVKDYYNVDPDLATNPAQRLEEFKALIDRTHQHGLKVIIDIVPNHVARQYISLAKPDSVRALALPTTKLWNTAATIIFIIYQGKISKCLLPKMAISLWAANFTRSAMDNLMNSRQNGRETAAGWRNPTLTTGMKR